MYKVAGDGRIPIRDAVGIAATAATVSFALIAFYIIGIGGGLLGYTVVPATPTDAIGFHFAWKHFPPTPSPRRVELS